MRMASAIAIGRPSSRWLVDRQRNSRRLYENAQHRLSPKTPSRYVDAGVSRSKSSFDKSLDTVAAVVCAESTTCTSAPTKASIC